MNEISVLIRNDRDTKDFQGSTTILYDTTKADTCH